MFQIEMIQDEVPAGIKINRRMAVRAILYRDGKLLMVQTNCGDYKFPGGGVRVGEDKHAALLREIREETGYTDIVIGPCIGTAIDQHVDVMEPEAFFRMEHFYYVCRMRSDTQTERQLDDYEKRMDFQPVWIEAEEAARSDRELFNASICDKKRKILSEIPWLERETQVLERIAGNPLCDMAFEVWECGAIIRDADRIQVRVGEKAGHANFVTTYDKKVQQELKRRLLAIVPDAVFVGEEEDIHASIAKGTAFIVDPIDGTTNFIKDYRCSCISVGMTVDGVQQAGIVYNPYLEELFTAERGRGAYLNGNRIHVSAEPLENGIVIFGTAPYYEELSKKGFAMAYDYFTRSLDVRRSGSAAIDLCNVACGRAELFFELTLSPWDYAAGGLIVEEAGGKVTTVEGEPVTLDRPCSVKATNGIAE